MSSAVGTFTSFRLRLAIGQAWMDDSGLPILSIGLSAVRFWLTLVLSYASIELLAFPGRYRFYEGIFMAVHSIESPIDFANFTTAAEEQVQDRTISATGDEINVGAFRGLAFALLLQTVLTILGCLSWEIWRSLAR